MKKRKKEVERFYLENFLTLWGKAYDRIEEREQPDFIVSFKREKIGIEVTEFHSDLIGVNGNSRRQIEEERRYLMENLYNRIKKIPELKGIFVFLIPRELKLIPKSRHKQFINELIQLVQDMIQTNREEMQLHERSSFLYQYIKIVGLRNIESSNYLHWDWGDASSVGVTENELIEALEDKIQKAGIYKQEEMNELWLLVVSGWRLSQAMPPPEHLEYKLNGFSKLNNLIKTSEYSKVYLYQHMFKSILGYDGCWKQLLLNSNEDTKS